MIDLNKIPYSTYIQLVDLMGKERAEDFIKRERYNFLIISNKILFLKFKNIIKKKPVLLYFLLLVIIILILLYYLDYVYIIF